MELNFRQYGSGQPLVILHGLFGSSDNWQTLGKRFSEDFEVYLVDQRNHGHSPHSDEFSYAIMAEDLYDFFRQHHLYDAVLIGHSMGGKTAMCFAQTNPDLLEKLIVADIGPQGYEMHHDTTLAGLKSFDPGSVSGRREAEEHVARHIESKATQQFLLKNLYWEEKGKLAWRFNLPVLEREMLEIHSAIPDKEVRTETLFIRGELSSYIKEEDYPMIRELFPNVSFETMQGAGHWVHADDPDRFYELVMGFSS